MSKPLVLVIGGTGGQGVPIVQELARDGFNVRVLTRNQESDNSKKLATLQNVSLIAGAPDDDSALKKAFKDVDYAFVNLNSWALGIKNEIFWGIRIFEIAVQSGVEHYIWSSLDNYFLETRYDDALRVGHYYGKGHVQQWMSALPHSPMRWSVITTSPYIEQLWNLQLPTKLESGEYEFKLPLDDGAIPYTCLDDMGYYGRWILENPSKSAGLNLKVAVEHVTLPQLASTFTEVTGNPAKATNITIDEWFDVIGGGGARDHLISSTTPGSKGDDATLLTVYQNFSRWWGLYQRSGGNKGLLRRDYALLDEIHPQRTKSLKQWMERVGYDGQTRQNPVITSAFNL
ncbi:NAD(P)-binding protein [Tothia fuscella]|uniref:NAD(P)-binding protein n=1 Tax=Tothia fuscella TaxID=1048955 RepID=A0A9P4NF49_9PEZI|nr:NAD(P)-binding protein [Tothia fuscella]